MPLNEYYLTSNGKLQMHQSGQTKVLIDIHNQVSKGKDFFQKFTDRDLSGLLAGAYMFKRKAVLIFCPSKRMCEEFAKNMANWAPKDTKDGEFRSIEDAMQKYLAALIYTSNDV